MGDLDDVEGIGDMSDLDVGDVELELNGHGMEENPQHIWVKVELMDQKVDDLGITTFTAAVTNTPGLSEDSVIRILMRAGLGMYDSLHGEE